MHKFLVILSVGFALCALDSTRGAWAKEIPAESDDLIAQDPDLAKDPALQEMVRKELNRYQNGEIPPAFLWDPAISELEMVEKLKAEGATQEEAMAAARQFHAASEELLGSYYQKEPLQQGPSEKERFKEELTERISAHRDHLQKHEWEQGEQGQRAVERQERQQERRPENAPRE